MNRRVLWTAVAALVFAGCASNDSTDPGQDPETADAAPPGPPPTTSGAACVFSHDCPDGTHCDLGQCTQTCNSENPCGAGLACTPRGRCAATAEDPGDPAPTKPAGKLVADISVVQVKSSDRAISVKLSGAGAVRYRLEAGADWIKVPTEPATFVDSTTLTLAVDPSAAPANAPAASVRVFSDQGDLTILVSTKPVMQGVWQGAMTFTAPVPLGTVQLGLAIRTDAPGTRAQIDAKNSTLWAAGASGPARGNGVVGADGTTTFTLEEVLDATSGGALFPESPSVFGARPIGRRLTLVLSVKEDGTLGGTATETIIGLTSNPIEIVGTVAFTRNSQATVPTFDAATPITMPADAVRGPGAKPDAACTCAGTTAGDKWQCIAGDSGFLAQGFPLDPFYLPASSGGFDVATGTASSSAYATASAKCAAALPPNPRASMSMSASNGGCINTGALDCARYLSTTTLGATNPSLASAGAMFVARSYLETFALLGNQSAVTALKDRLSTDAKTTQLRTDLLAARASFDAGLAFFFDPRLFEELRATTAADAQVGPLAEANDRRVLRRAADALGRSASVTVDALDIEHARASDVDALHARAQADATLFFLEAALLADLDARWRGTTDALPEVVALGSTITSYAQRIRGIDPRANPLGIPNAYVPLLASGPSGPGTQTNFERLLTIAKGTVATSVASDAAAAATARDFDLSVSTATTQLANTQAAYLSTIVSACGSSFVVGGTPDPDLGKCGATSGTAKLALIDVEGGRLALTQSKQALDAQYQLFLAQSEAFAKKKAIDKKLIQFVDNSNKVIFGLSMAQATLQATAAVFKGISDATDLTKTLGRGFSVAAGAAEAAADLMQPFIDQQHDLQHLAEIRAGAEKDDIDNELTLKETVLQFGGLATQVAISANDLSGKIVNHQTILETVAEASAGLAESKRGAARDIAKDPSFRIVQSANTVAANRDLRQAKRDLYFAARALEYETNTRLPQITTAIYAAQSAAELSRLADCLTSAWTEWRLLVSSENKYTTEISLAKNILGIKGPVVDALTKTTMSAGEQFRRYLFAHAYTPDPAHVWPAMQFGTTLDDKGSLFSALICNDRITGIEAKLVGSGLAGSSAEVQILASGASTLRSCTASSGGDEIRVWNLRPAGASAPAVIQSGVNDYPAGVSPNQSLYYYAVAQSQWTVAIPDASTSPANAAIDVNAIDDIVLRISHAGIAKGSATTTFSPSCH